MCFATVYESNINLGKSWRCLQCVIPEHKDILSVGNILESLGIYIPDENGNQ